MPSAAFLLHSNRLLLDHLTPDRLLELSRTVRVREVKRGDVLFGAGAPATTVFLVHGGRVKVTREESGSPGIITAIHRPGDLVGDEALCGSVRQGRAKALTGCLLSEIDAPDLRSLLLEHPPLLLAWALAKQRHASTLEERLVGVAFHTLRDRLWAALRHLADRFGYDGPDGRRLLDLRLTEEDLAAWIGSHRVSVHHELRHVDFTRARGRLAVAGASIGGAP